MKRLVKIFQEILNILSTILISGTMPIVDSLIDVSKTILDLFGLDYKTIDKLSQIIIKNIIYFLVCLF